jgi:preprotein translocase SecE subunit
MAPPTRRRRPAACILLSLLAQRAATFAPRPRLAAPPRHRHTPLASSSKPLPDSNIPGLTRDKDDLPDSEEDAAAVEVLESTTEAPVAEAPAEADQYADIRERIKARAAELDLKATAPKEVFEATEQKNVLQSMVDTAVEETQKEEEALAYSDGLGVVEGMKKELDLIIWPGPQEVLNTLGLVVVITAVMVIYVLGVDKFLQFALDPLFHYPAKEVIAEKAAKATAQAAAASAAL